MQYLSTSLSVVAYYLVLVQGATFRSASDIREYAKFLKDSVTGLPEEPLDSRLAELQNEEERSGKFEGDIVLTKQQQRYLLREYAGAGERNGVRDPQRLWPDGRVYYNISASDYTQEQLSAIDAAIEELNDVSCVKFVKINSYRTRNYVQILSEVKGACYSQVGMAGGQQRLNLFRAPVGFGCFRHGTIIHELLHAAGFFHQHTASSRDDYLTIHWDKIMPEGRNSFRKQTSQQSSSFGRKYDYGSIMHYSEYSFSIDGSKTMEPVEPTSEKIGQRLGLSEEDKIKLNIMYCCPGYTSGRRCRTLEEDGGEEEDGREEENGKEEEDGGEEEDQ